MGLIKAVTGAVGGMFADQWKEFFYCDALPENVLVRKGMKRTSSRSSNYKGNDNIISAGSTVAVADGQCMMIVEQGKIVEVCAEPGEYVFDASTEPSIFAGELGDSIMEAFRTVGKRLAYGGDTAKDQRVYYFNTKEIMNNRFGTPTPIMFEVVNKRIGMSRTVQVRCNGTYTYVISNPLIFYSRVCGNVEYEFTRDKIDAQLKSEFIDALQPAMGALSELELRPAQLPAKVNELKDAMNDALRTEWAENRGITIGKIALNPITLTPEDMKKINQMEDAMTLGANPFMMAGRMTDASANAMEAAASNESGAMNGFFGMNMAQGGMNGGFGAAQSFYQQGVQQMQNAAAPETDGWTCECGAVNTGNFCSHCGEKKPQPKVTAGWKCACGTENSGNFCSHCGAKRPTESWVCGCGTENKGNFCSHCGSKRP